ncbi:hypothetical protein LTR85_008840 [Meristemomyces frigidus]|nr:hypothetical protein LTR85_008840 [Meristemomyces frigidus]
MSFWDRYLAPGDVRARQQLQATPAPSSPSPQRDADQPIARPEPAPRIDAAHRRRRQDALLYGGLAFTVLSLLITRRSLLRKQAQTQIRLKTFEPSNTPPPKVDGGLEAVEALGLATLNVFTIAMATTGGLMTYFDVADVEDMRDRVREGVGFDVYGGESEADKELEAWVADVLSRKDGQGDLKEGIAQKLHELAEMDKKHAQESERSDGR